MAVGALPVLEVEHLSIAYRTEGGVLDAVRDVSFRIDPNESFGLVGESGSGKSTLAMGAIGYLADNGHIVGGSVRLDGVELTGLPRSAMQHVWGSKIGVVYQSPGTAMNPSITLGRQLMEVARLHLGLERTAAHESVIAILSKVAMPDPESVMRRYPHQLSGGMLQRCVIAMALITNPRLLIMDEPTTALDVTTQAVVLDLVADLKREFDSAILYITHDLGVVARICDRVGVMYAGEFMETGSIRELFKRPRHAYTLNLMGCVPKFDPTGVKRSLVTIPGYIPRVDDLPAGCIFSPRCSFVEDACVSRRPTLVEAESAHETACRRWTIVPPPAEHLATATAVVASASDGVETRLLEASQIVKLYPAPASGSRLLGNRRRRPVRAVDDVSLWVDQGRTLGVVGESGSGKTTLARTIIGLVEATSGEVVLDGDRLERKTSKRSRGQLRKAQMVFQNPDASLNPRRSVADAIGRPIRLLLGAKHADLPERVLELLKAVNLPSSYYYRLPDELSGGEKQRVAIARAFAADPELVFCDEPISSLDVSVQGALMNLLLDLQAEKRTSYLFISHDLAAVQHISDFIAVMYLGHLMEWGDAQTVLTPPFHPYTEALISAIPIADPDVRQTTIRLKGSVPSAMDIPPGCRFHTRCPRYVGEICATQEPAWQEGKGGHRVYCHIPLAELSALQAETIVYAPHKEIE